MENVQLQRAEYGNEFITRILISDMLSGGPLSIPFKVALREKISVIFFAGHRQIQYSPRDQCLDQVGNHLLVTRDMFQAIDRKNKIVPLIFEQFELKRLYRHADIISEQSGEALGKVRTIYGGRVEKLTMGCDFSFWTPAPSAGEKESTRRKLNIPRGKTVFFASGNFMPRKQLDKLIRVFCSISDRNDFFLIVAGQGDKSSTGMLASLAAPLIDQKKAILHPYAVGEELRDIYWVSDIYASVATDEGGPASVMKAMACGLPVISTPVGETADRMRKYGVGKIVPVKKYDEWTKAILEMLEGKVPLPLDLKIAKEAYDWPNVARRFINVYDDLIAVYYGTEYPAT